MTTDELPDLDVAGLLSEAERIRSELALENGLRRTQDIRRNIAIGLSILVAVAATFIAFRSGDDARTARRALVASEHRTEIAREASCWNQRREAFNGVEADKVLIRKLVTALLRLDPSPEAQAGATAFLVDYDRAAEQQHPRRDCSPAGIARYLGQKPPTEGTS